LSLLQQAAHTKLKLFAIHFVCNQSNNSELS
jgi:hypothetical protein